MAAEICGGAFFGQEAFSFPFDANRRPNHLHRLRRSLFPRGHRAGSTSPVAATDTFIPVGLLSFPGRPPFVRILRTGQSGERRIRDYESSYRLDRRLITPRTNGRRLRLFHGTDCGALSSQIQFRKAAACRPVRIACRGPVSVERSVRWGWNSVAALHQLDPNEVLAPYRPFLLSYAPPV